MGARREEFWIKKSSLSPSRVCPWRHDDDDDRPRAKNKKIKKRESACETKKLSKPTLSLSLSSLPLSSLLFSSPFVCFRESFFELSRDSPFLFAFTGALTPGRRGSSRESLSLSLSPRQI